MIFCVVINVSGMLQAGFSAVILMAGTFGVVVVSKINTFSTVEVQVLLISPITVCLLRQQSWNKTDNMLLATLTYQSVFSKKNFRVIIIIIVIGFVV